MDQTQLLKLLAEAVGMSLDEDGADQEATDIDPDSPLPAKAEDIWTCFLDIVTNSKPALEHFYPMFLNFSEKFSRFRKETPDFVAQKIHALNDPALSYEDAVKEANSLVLVSPFVSIELAKELFNTLIDICDRRLREAQTLPMEIIDIYDSIPTDLFDPEDIENMYARIIELEQTEKSAAALCMFAPVSETINDFLEEAEEFTVSTIRKHLAGDALNQMAAALLIEYNYRVFGTGTNPDIEPTEIFNILLPLLKSDNAAVVKRAGHAFRELVRSTYFLSENIISKLIAEFPEMSSSHNLHHFFKILSVCIYPDSDDEEEEEDNGPEISVIQPILDFVTSTMKTGQTPLIKAHCLEAIADLAARDSMFVEDCYQDALTVFSEIVESGDKLAMARIGSFAISMTKCFEDTSLPAVKAALPALLDVVSEESLPVRTRLHLAADLAVLLAENMNDDLVPRLTDIAVEFLDKYGDKYVPESCAIAFGLRPKLTSESANKIFESISKHVRTSTNNQDLGIYFHTMHKVMKKNDISIELAESLINDIMQGKIAILKGEEPHQIQPTETSIFMFIRSYILKFPQKAKAICANLIDNLGSTPFGSMSAVLAPISAALEAGLLKGDDFSAHMKDLVSKLIQLFDRIEATDANVMISVVEVLSHIWDHDQELVKPVEPLFEKFLVIAKDLQDQDAEEDYEMMMDAMEAMPVITQFVLNVYATNDEVEVNEELLVPLIKMMPYPPGVTETSEILDSLVTLLEDSEKFECIVVPALEMFTEFLLMKKSELDEFQLEPDTVKSMKDTLKTIVKRKPAIGKQISKAFSSSRAKMNRFNALIR